MGNYCGGNLPATIESSTGAVTIRFISYGSVNHKGFNLQYRGLTSRSKGIHMHVRTYIRIHNISLQRKMLYGIKFLHTIVIETLLVCTF